MFEVKSRIRAPSALSSIFLPCWPLGPRPAPLRDARRRSTIKLLYGPGIASPGLARVRDIVHMVCLYNILTDTLPPRARPGPPRPSSASGGPPAAARCGGVTNPTTEHRDAVGRSEAQLGVCIAHPGLSPGPINRRLRRRAQELLLQPVHINAQPRARNRRETVFTPFSHRSNAAQERPRASRIWLCVAGTGASGDSQKNRGKRFKWASSRHRQVWA